jgi:hypothetical protein
MSAKDNTDSTNISAIPPVGREPERHPEAAGAREIAQKAMNGGDGQHRGPIPGTDDALTPNHGQSRTPNPGSRSRFSIDD